MYRNEKYKPKTKDMKKIFALTLLAAVLLLSESFTGKTSAPKNAPAYNFTVDGAPFDAMTVNSYSAQLNYDEPKATLTFFGNALRTKDGKELPTRIEIEYVIRDAALGEVNVTKATYEYNNQKYNLLAGSAFMSVTKMKWNPGKRGFVMSADIFCKVQKPYIMEEFVPVFVIRGSVQNITVNLPMS